jgi:single-stranded-DNA-specific exonuclease
VQGLTHRWIEPKPAGGVPRQDGGFPGLDPVVARILLARGLEAGPAAAAFLEPRLTALHDPSAMPDLDRAAERILCAVRARESIVVYGDYDVDGIAASAILFHCLRAIDPEARVTTFVPHRMEEGYGLNGGALERLIDEGASVIVSVDCGVTAVGEATVCRARGVDLIITDHHAADFSGPMPDVFALVHPSRPDATGTRVYPFADLCGAGVAFKLAWRMLTMAHGTMKLPEAQRELLLDLLALAGLATIADVVPLVGENRVIARFGLSRIKHTSLVGMHALLEASGLTGQRVGSEEAGFTLGPRLNACGRMGHAREAVELLTTAEGPRAAEIARALNGLNDERRAVERRILDQACAMIEESGIDPAERRSIVLADERWHAGVIGIVCSRLVGRYHRPTILLQRTEGELKGSCRSIDGFDICRALHACAVHLDRFGGHEMAAGLTMRADRFESFATSFEDHARSAIDAALLAPALRIDCEATLDELSASAVRSIERLGPFGRGNPSPSILVRGVTSPRGAEPLGQHGRHLAMWVRQGSRDTRLVGWGLGEHVARIAPGARMDVVIEPRISTWAGTPKVEPTIRDVRVCAV